MKDTDESPVYPAGWQIKQGRLTLFGFDGQGESYPVLELQLWNPYTGERLVPTNDIIE